MLPGSRIRSVLLLAVVLALAASLGAPGAAVAAPSSPSAAGLSAAGAASADQAADRLVAAVNRGRPKQARQVAVPAVVTRLVAVRRAGLRLGGRDVNPCQRRTARTRDCNAVVLRGRGVAGVLNTVVTRRDGGWITTRATVTLFG